MKKLIILLVLITGLSLTMNRANAQISTGQDMQQLVLDIEKLTQFKAILSDMKNGYTILTQGYKQVKDISEGNFNLHSAFLNSLMMVSPEVRKYVRIADIISAQASIVSEYKATLKFANASGHFSAGELIYMNSVFSRLLSQTLDNLTTLADVITDNKLRMSDAERLKSIDELYSDTQNKLVFLRSFDNKVAVLSLQRAKEENDVQELKNLY